MSDVNALAPSHREGFFTWLSRNGYSVLRSQCAEGEKVTLMIGDFSRTVILPTDKEAILPESFGPVLARYKNWVYFNKKATVQSAPPPAPEPESASVTIADLVAAAGAFGDKLDKNRSCKNALVKLALEEVPELLADMSDPLELADIVILAMDIAYLKKWDLEKAIKEKLEIINQRTYKQDSETGIWSHVKATGSSLSGTHPSHDLYTVDDQMVKDNERLWQAVAEGGLAVCKGCGEFEAGLEEPCINEAL